MKRIICLVLIGVIATFTLCSCGQEDTVEETLIKITDDGTAVYQGSNYIRYEYVG